MTDHNRNDREALIEKAAKAILDANDIHPDDPGGDHGYYAKTWEYAVQDARAALAVFEQAHTYTSDEREAEGWREAEAYADDHDPSKRAETADDYMSGWRAADRLRRTVTPEPSVEEPEHFAPKPPMATNRFVAEPQAEPSDAQVEAALDAFEDARTNRLAERGEAMHDALLAAYELRGEGR